MAALVGENGSPNRTSDLGLIVLIHVLLLAVTALVLRWHDIVSLGAAATCYSLGLLFYALRPKRVPLRQHRLRGLPKRNVANVVRATLFGILLSGITALAVLALQQTELYDSLVERQNERFLKQIEDLRTEGDFQTALKRTRSRLQSPISESFRDELQRNHVQLLQGLILVSEPNEIMNLQDELQRVRRAYGLELPPPPEQPIKLTTPMTLDRAPKKSENDKPKKQRQSSKAPERNAPPPASDKRKVDRPSNHRGPRTLPAGTRTKLVRVQSSNQSTVMWFTLDSPRGFVRGLKAADVQVSSNSGAVNRSNFLLEEYGGSPSYVVLLFDMTPSTRQEESKIIRTAQKLIRESPRNFQFCVGTYAAETKLSNSWTRDPLEVFGALVTTPREASADLRTAILRSVMLLRKHNGGQVIAFTDGEQSLVGRLTDKQVLTTCQNSNVRLNFVRLPYPHDRRLSLTEYADTSSGTVVEWDSSEQVLGRLQKLFAARAHGYRLTVSHRSQINEIQIGSGASALSLYPARQQRS